MIFALSAIPVVIAAGMAIDVGRAYLVKVRLGAALDAAALAVGSETNLTGTQLTSALQNYFTANYPSTALGTNVTVAPVPADADLTAAVVNYQAQATVPMTLMKLAGFNSLTVTVTAQTKKTVGLEVAVVLDNTGSMLCGANDGTDAACAPGVVAADTTCTNSSNNSRICTLINAATQFVNTLTGAISATQQLYVSIVPYVTTVNVGSAFCSGATSCSHITTDTCSGDFTDQRGNIIPVIPVTGNTTSGSKTVSSISPNTSAMYAGMKITGTGIAAGTTVSSVGSSTQITLSANATATQTGVNLTIGPYTAVSTSINLSAHTGTWTNGSSTITSISPNTTGIAKGMLISGTGIPAGATVATIVSSTSITISANATSSQSAKALTITNLGGITTNGSNIVTSISVATTPTVGMVITGSGIPNNTAISSVDSVASAYTGGTGQVHICNNATATGDTALAFYNPVTYDTTNTNTTSNWMGCVVEPTSSDENNSVSGVINSSVTDPDYTEPTSWPNWYPFWWPSDSGTNTWPTVKAQSTATELQGKEITDWLAEDGPNQGCPVPMLPLTDVTSAAGKTQVLNTISSMWPRDAGGTQVHIGMIWGWRTLSPNGPFTPVDGHPLSYSDASSTGWKKAVILMTDGEEEWPATDNMTGLGQIADGKIGTSSTSTAVTHLNTRLANVCSNMAANGDFIIYTIGLGSSGSSNTQLQNCATTSNGGFFEAASPSNIAKVFNDIAKSLIALRLTQ